jgi:hypothetical protein
MMKKTEKKNGNDSLGMSRRDVLKIRGAGALYAPLPGEGFGSSPSH